MSQGAIDQLTLLTTFCAASRTFRLQACFCLAGPLGLGLPHTLLRHYKTRE